MPAPGLSWLPTAARTSPWDQVHVAVLGLGLSGFAAADALQHLGATVTVLDDIDDGSAPGSAQADRATLLEILGVDVRLGTGASADVPDGLDLVVTSPGWPPDAEVFGILHGRDVRVWGDVELAWRLR